MPKWPAPTGKPRASLVRHLVKVHGLRLEGTETAADCDEAEGWISGVDWHEECNEFPVNQYLWAVQ